MEAYERLALELGATKAKRLMKLTENYNSYVANFKKQVDKILEPIEHEILVATKFVTKEEKQQLLQKKEMTDDTTN